MPAEPSRRLRPVSVLFLDIVGGTKFIQTLDPEKVQATVDGALAAFTAIVEQHGGEVLCYAGGDLKVAFGAHDTAATREDDAERAVHCGLALLAEAARRGDEVKRLHDCQGFNARVGIHTGGAAPASRTTTASVAWRSTSPRGRNRPCRPARCASARTPGRWCAACSMRRCSRRWR